MTTRAFLGILVATGLAACASTGAGLSPGVSTEAQVRQAMGHPAAEFRHGDGSRTLAYPQGPMGTQTYMAELASDGRVLEVRAALNEENFQRISPGMAREEVLRLIGPPGDSMYFPGLRQDSWEWRFIDAWGYLAVFSVNLDANGNVASKFTRRIERERNPFGIF